VRWPEGTAGVSDGRARMEEHMVTHAVADALCGMPQGASCVAHSRRPLSKSKGEEEIRANRCRSVYQHYVCLAQPVRSTHLSYL